MEDAKQLV